MSQDDRLVPWPDVTLGEGRVPGALKDCIPEAADATVTWYISRMSRKDRVDVEIRIAGAVRKRL